MTEPIRIELPTDFAVGTVNVYLFTEPEPVLVDTGVKTEASWEALVAALAAHELSLADLKKVVITHPHVDHFGQAATIASQSNAQILVSQLGESWLTMFPTMWERRIEYYRDHFMKQVGFSQERIGIILDYMATMVTVCDPVPVDRVTTFPLDAVLQMGGMRWQVEHMPGHANHQTCFYQPETRQFLSADMLLAKAPTPIVERPLQGSIRIPGLPQFLASLDRVASLDIERVFPGHGEPFGRPLELIQRQRRRIQLRTNECLKLIGEGYCTVAQLVDKMYAHLPIQFRFAGLWMLVGYLDLLRAEGLVEEDMVDGVWHYHKSGN